MKPNERVGAVYRGRRPDPVSRALRRCLTISTPKGVTLWRRDRMD